MRIQFRTKVLGLVGLLGAAGTQSGCSADPTSSASAAPERLAASEGAVLTVNGPSVIFASGNYTYSAHFQVPYASFQWATRHCFTSNPTADCGQAYSNVTATTIDAYTTQYTKALTYSCVKNGTAHFHVRVIGSGFGVPAQTKYKVTSLCGANP